MNRISQLPLVAEPVLDSQDVVLSRQNSFLSSLLSSPKNPNNSRERRSKHFTKQCRKTILNTSPKHSLIYIYVCIYVYVYMYMYICICIYIYRSFEIFPRPGRLISGLIEQTPNILLVSFVAELGIELTHAWLYVTRLDVVAEYLGISQLLSTFLSRDRMIVYIYVYICICI